MGDAGIERPLLALSKTPILDKGGAKSDAPVTPGAPNITKYPDLEVVVNSWPTLPEHIKQTIMVLVRSV